jgi:hypothetical protein
MSVDGCLSLTIAGMTDLHLVAGNDHRSAIETKYPGLFGWSYFEPGESIRAQLRALNPSPRFGFEWQHHENQMPVLARRQTGTILRLDHFLMISVPHWFVILLFGWVPVWAMIRFYKSRRKKGQGLCQVCGYDLRATPDRCPECGTIPANAPANSPTTVS